MVGQTFLSAPVKIDLGVVPSNGKAEHAFLVSNRSDSPVEIDKIIPTCECLQVQLPKRIIPAGGDALAIAKLDLTKEKDDSTDKLGIEVKGYTPKGKLAFSMIVDVLILSKQAYRETAGEEHE